MTDVNKALNALAETLQEEADIKVKASLALFDSLSEEQQAKVIEMLGMPSDYTRESLTDTLDTMELIDHLENINDFMQSLSSKKH